MVYISVGVASGDTVIFNYYYDATLPVTESGASPEWGSLLAANDSAFRYKVRVLWGVIV